MQKSGNPDKSGKVSCLIIILLLSISQVCVTLYNRERFNSSTWRVSLTTCLDYTVHKTTIIHFLQSHCHSNKSQYSKNYIITLTNRLRHYTVVNTVETV